MATTVLECDSKRIESIRLYKAKTLKKIKTKEKKSKRIKQYHYPFLLLYMCISYWTIQTIGKPYETFLQKAESEGFEVMEGLTKMRAELEYAFSDINNPDRAKESLGWFDWMSMDIEEHAALKKRLAKNEQTVLDSLPKTMRVPKKYMPDFWPLLAMGIVVCLHVLIVLLQYWSVGFDTWLNYTLIDVDNVVFPEDDDIPFEDEQENMKILNMNLPSHARLTPKSGKDLLVPIMYYPSLGVTFTYHRRRFVYDTQNQLWTKIRCRTTDLPLSFFPTWKGLTSEHQITSTLLRFGKNEFNIQQPSFKELYKAQLLSPFTVFQIFCVVLWMLDDYWQYSLFTLFMVLMFEATVVWSRIRSLGLLKGMGNMTRTVYVYRMDQWISMDSSEVLPGDILSLTRHKPHFKNKVDDKTTKQKKEEEGGDVVPADIILLSGSAVVSEASLTGESIPQMKQGLVMEEEDEDLDMKGKHKLHILYAGTKLLQCSPNNNAEEESSFYAIPPPPDHGCVTFVLRTGFSSSQGKLVRMIEGSQEKVKGHEKETALLLFLLFLFALASSSYVLYQGFTDEQSQRSRYELLLHCILILTSVIPPELPMQMALAVNSSLMILMKMQIFCTEPYRVPMAGKLDACLFDKTGTLTTDELVAVGLYIPDKNKETVESVEKVVENLTPMSQVHNATSMVLAGCHSLVCIEDEIVGDPLEAAAISSIRWCVNEGGCISPAPATEKRVAGMNMMVDSMDVSSMEILHRFHFASKLGRMSCVVQDNFKRCFVLTKGSPEAIGLLLSSKPDNYDTVSKQLAKCGYRVLSLAYKPISKDDATASTLTRSSVEQDLIFVGLVCFTCRIRKDTKAVIRKLKEGGLSIAMITGDALFTALHVAQHVDICMSGKEDEEDLGVDSFDEKNPELKKLLVQKKKQAPNSERKLIIKPILILEYDDKDLFWSSYDTELKVMDFNVDDIPTISTKYDLAVVGKTLSHAISAHPKITTMMQYIQVFARMTPEAKETVIQCLHSVNKLCLMCGDGANDVGALKQADVGVALLSGFGDVNVEKGEDSYKKIKDENNNKTGKNSSLVSPMTRQQLEAMRMMPVALIKMQLGAIGVDQKKYPDLTEKEDLITLWRIKSTEIAQKKHDLKAAKEKMKENKTGAAVKRKVDAQSKQIRMAERVKELEAQGESWAQFKALKEFMSDELQENQKKKKQMIKSHSIEGSAATMAAQLEDLEMEDTPLIKIGDASIAAPFTSKMPSIKSCVDIIRQGRCTLVTSIQMYQILALNCLISSYSLSVLYLDGVKYGDTQMTLMGILGSISFMSVSRTKPLDKLSPVKPLTSIFHPSLFSSLLLQFTVHLITMYIATREAKKYMPTDFKVNLDGEFAPGILNSVVFLVSNVQHVAVFVVNLQGRPFMSGLTENRSLLWSLLASFILTFMFASESVPSLNKYFQLVPFPDPGFRNFIFYLLAGDVFLCLTFDRAMKFIFCRHILLASVADVTFWDVLKLGRTFAVIFWLMNMFLGNNETWDEMIRQDELLMNETATSVIGNISGSEEL